MMIKSSAWVQIILVVMATVAFSYILKETSTLHNGQVILYKKTTSTATVLQTIGNLLFDERAFATALDATGPAVYTCVRSTSGKNCQEFIATECAAQCDGSCIPSARSDVADCKLGTCYDPQEGSCTTAAPKGLCEASQGQWYDDPYANVPVCKRGCCIAGQQTDFTTPQECTVKGARSGLRVEFRPEVDTLVACLALSTTQEEGACVLQQESANTCKFTTRASCAQLNGRFVAGYLCSNPELNTNCQKQARASCVQGKDEIYWFDSCGNRENIYDANKVRSYNNGLMLSKDQSCNVGSGTNALANQALCGNCDYLSGSKCGVETSSQKLSDSVQEVVCRDLRCRDEKGVLHDQGESWCAYEGAIGVQNGRSSDTVGSRHYRKVCIDGEIRTEPCADYRNEICVQSDSPLPRGGTFSAAACRINLGHQCYEYNAKGKKDQCEKNPDCFIKKVTVSSKFKFNTCVPKYKPGFNLEERGDGAEALCKFATQTCTYIKIKKIGHDKEINKECLTPKFAQEMNNYCMSLGDCGAQANYLGEVTSNYKLRWSKAGVRQGYITRNYIDSLKLLADETLHATQPPAQPGEKYFAELGMPGILANPGVPQDPTAAFRSQSSMIAGVVGIAALYAAQSGLAAKGVSSLVFAYQSAFTSSTSQAAALGPTVSAAAGVVAGAAIGFALTAFLIDVTGIGRGLSPAVAYTLMAAGAVGGAIIGASLTSTGTSLLAAIGIVPVVGWIILAVVIIVIIIFSLLGIGDVKKIRVKFTCQPWQPPVGGRDCNKCGSDGFPCSKYACQSLGQTCSFINEEETGVGECVDISPNDAAPPVIRPMTELLPPTYTAQTSDLGVAIKSSEPDGCIQETYNLVLFGLQLDEPGQCRMEYNHTASFDDMEYDLADRNRFLRNHTLPLTIPSLESLGLDGFDPHARIDYNLYVRCMDKSGNKNDREYAINFCIKQGPDITPPLVVARDPALETVSFTTTALNASIYTNEPADCKWDAQDRTYEQMSQTLECSTDFEDRTYLGWRCTTTFPLVRNDSVFYIRCKDQPWRAAQISDEDDPPQLIDNPNANESLRNSAPQSFEFNVHRSTIPLRIESAAPHNQTLRFSTQPASVDVEVRTTDGYDGTARCFYTIGNTSEIEFFQGAWTSYHRQVFQTLFSGTHHIAIRCEDVVGNTAQTAIEFKVEVDAQPPQATRIYAQGSSFVVVTNEPATCAVSSSKPVECQYAFQNATMMDGTGYIHTTPFTDSQIYYVKCNDNFGNAPTSCTIIAKKGDILPRDNE